MVYSMMNLYDIRNDLLSGLSIYDLPLKVTYYARVSTDKYEQLNSLDNQVSYYEDFIKRQSKWTFIDGYVDEGISGTSTNKRDSFKRMIRDAKNGRFNLIVTKEISRFARDTLDSIKYTRMLLEAGVGVYFQSDNINTFNSDSELRLTIMSSIAQEEVRKLSERVKFGCQQSIAKGSVLGNSSIWGYEKDATVKKDEPKRLVIVPEQAEIVRKIYDMYVNDHIGMRKISQRLAEEGIFNSKGKPFTQGVIKYILTNPKYKGYYSGNLTRIVDYHSKQRIYISEEDRKIYEDNVNVPPIVSEAIWNKAQEIIRERVDKHLSKDISVYQNRYPFSGKIFCMDHGEPQPYRRKKQVSSGIAKKVVITWRCREFLDRGISKCSSPILYDEELKEVVGKSILDYISNADIINDLMQEYKDVEDTKNYKQEILDKQHQLEQLQKKKSRLLDLIVREVINESEFKEESDSIIIAIHKLEDEIRELEDLSKNVMDNYKYMEKIRQKAIEKLKYENTDVEELIWEFLDRVEVYHSDEEDTVNLRIILSTNKNLGISFNRSKHPFGLNHMN